MRTRAEKNRKRSRLAVLRLSFESLEARRMLAGIVPNDPLFQQQWNLHNTGQTDGPMDIDMDLPQAWTITTGSMSTVVAILDQGVDYTHEDLYLNIWINEGEIPSQVAAALVDTDADGIITFRDLNESANASYVSDINNTGYIDAGDLLADDAWEDGVDSDGNGYVDDLVGWDWEEGDNDPYPTDGKGHGSTQAGRIGAVGNNGIGMSGINWQIRMMPLRFRQEHDWQIDSVVSAIDYAVDMDVPISNNSWSTQNCMTSSCGSGEFSQEIYDAIDRARAEGHLFVTGLTRDVDLDTEPQFWAEYDLENVLIVSGTDEYDRMYGHARGERTVDLAAPTINSVGTRPGNDYSFTNSGASATISLVTGVAALVHSQHPDWDAARMKAHLLSRSERVKSLEGFVASGGRVNAAFGVASVGDSNVDGVFDSADFVTIFQKGKYEDAIPDNATFEEGDWNGDGDFDSSDMVFAFRAGGYVRAATPSASEIASAIDSFFAQDEHGTKKQ